MITSLSQSNLQINDYSSKKSVISSSSNLSNSVIYDSHLATFAQSTLHSIFHSNRTSLQVDTTTSEPSVELPSFPSIAPSTVTTSGTEFLSNGSPTTVNSIPPSSLHYSMRAHDSSVASDNMIEVRTSFQSVDPSGTPSYLLSPKSSKASLPFSPLSIPLVATKCLFVVPSSSPSSLPFLSYPTYIPPSFQSMSSPSVVYSSPPTAIPSLVPNTTPSVIPSTTT